MLKHLMNSGSLLSYAVYDAESEAKAARDATRAELLKNNTVVVTEPAEPVEKEAGTEDDEDLDDEDVDPKDPEEKEIDPNETEDQKKAREVIEAETAAKTKLAAKAQRKQDRMQRRIDEATAAKRVAEDALKAFKEANPDTKLTEEEVEAKANAIAEKKIRDKEIKDLQDAFDATCDKLQKAALKLDNKFNDNVDDIVEQFGPIPSFIIGTLDEYENGPEVLVNIMKDDDLAEELWKMKPAKMAKTLVEMSLKLTADKKKPKRQISKVETITPVIGNNVQSTIITADDTKPEHMERFVAKRRAQIEERRKAGR